jgi:N-acetylneuraminic acid mutarotase
LAADPRPTALDQPRSGLALALAADGTLFAVGGVGPSSPNPLRADARALVGPWRTFVPPGNPRWYPGAAFVGRDLYVVGGSDRLNAARAVHAYDPRTGAWRRRAPLLEARLGHGTVAVDGRLYAIGGQGEAPNARWQLHTVERYDPAADRWARVADLYEEVGFAGVAASGGRIYVAGGTPLWSSFRRPLASLYVYDPSTNRWRIGPRMPTARSHLSLVAAQNGRLYAIGGDAGVGAKARPTTAVEEFDPATDRWRTVAGLAVARIGAAAVADGSTIAVAGGFAIVGGKQTTLGSIERISVPR